MNGADVLNVTLAVDIDSTYTLTFAFPSPSVSTAIPLMVGAEVNVSEKECVPVAAELKVISPTSSITSSPSGELAKYAYLGGCLKYGYVFRYL